jgi:hypothetical protein
MRAARRHPHLAINQPSDDGAGARFRQQRNSKSRADKAHQTPATDVVAHDLGAVAGRRHLRNQEIMKLRSGIAPAQQDRLILKVDPVDRQADESGADPKGYAGPEDEVDNHGGMLFKASILSALLSIGSEAGANNKESALVQALRQRFSHGLSQVGEQVVGRSLNVQPTITIRPGFPVRVIVSRDLVFEPYAG